VKAYLAAVAYYLPEKVLDNNLLNRQHPEWSVDKIAAKTGIAERRIAADDEFSSDMAVKAANLLFEQSGIDKSVVDFILLCTQSPDYFLPTTACILQDRLGISRQAGALDFNLGCSGFVYGLGLAKGLIATGQAKNVLLITSETYSKFIHDKDRSNKTLFGDAAAASLVTADPLPNGWRARIGEFVYGTDGSGAEHLIVRNGGVRNRLSKGTDVYNEDGFERNDDYLYMDGKAIFNFTAFHVPDLIKKTLEKNNLSENSIAYYVLHQANEFMLQTIRKRAKIQEDKFVISMSGCGNTVSSTIPIALYNILQQNPDMAGKHLLLCGFGVGLSMGACVLQF
jgi:3-oxoacyl-[acyl-carrier-protein] synthase III